MKEKEGRGKSPIGGEIQGRKTFAQKWRVCVIGKKRNYGGFEGGMGLAR